MKLRVSVVDVLEQGAVHGTEHLAYDILHCSDKAWLRKILRQLEYDGELSIEPSNGGRGHKTIYKRNRNSPGLPRKNRRERNQ